MAEHQESTPAKKESRPTTPKEAAAPLAEALPLVPLNLHHGEPTHLTPAVVLVLQRTHGNRFVQHLIGRHQGNGPHRPPVVAASRVQRIPGPGAATPAEQTPEVEARQEFERALAPNNSNLRELVDGRGDAELYALREDSGFLDRMQTRLRADQFAYLAAALVLNYTYAPGARSAAMRLLHVQLSAPAVARRMLDRDGQVVIVPANRRMTDLEEFRPLRGRQTFDGRWWAHVRGVGNVRVDGRLYTAITEENLLGGNPDPAIYGADTEAGVPAEPAAGGYAAGYSTTTHEFGHAIQRQGLSSADQRIIHDAYRQKAHDTNDPPMLFENHWVDGPRISPTPPAAEAGYDEASWQAHVAGMRPGERRRYECYASQNDREYFAQLSNAYLDTNTGIEPTTMQPRNNGRDWIAAHEPQAVLLLLDRLYHRHAVGPAGGPAAGGGPPAGPGASP